MVAAQWERGVHSFDEAPTLRKRRAGVVTHRRAVQRGPPRWSARATIPVGPATPAAGNPPGSTERHMRRPSGTRCCPGHHIGRPGVRRCVQSGAPSIPSAPVAPPCFPLITSPLCVSPPRTPGGARPSRSRSDHESPSKVYGYNRNRRRVEQRLDRRVQAGPGSLEDRGLSRVRPAGGVEVSRGFEKTSDVR